MKNVIILSGFARSGKTTFCGVANNFGFSVASTSDILTNFSERLLEQLTGKDYNLSDKQVNHQIGYNVMTSREVKIAVAEECIVKYLGRQALARAAAKIVNDSPYGSTVVYEAFNNHECHLFMDAITNKASITYHIAYIRSPFEQANADSRELIDTLPYAHQCTFHNHYNDEYLRAIESYLETFKK